MYKRLGYVVYRTVLEYYSGDPDEDAYGKTKTFDSDDSRINFKLFPRYAKGNVAGQGQEVNHTTQTSCSSRRFRLTVRIR
jgi:hypothetical protein